VCVSYPFAAFDSWQAKLPDYWHGQLTIALQRCFPGSTRRNRPSSWSAMVVVICCISSAAKMTHLNSLDLLLDLLHGDLSAVVACNGKVTLQSLSASPLPLPTGSRRDEGPTLPSCSSHQTFAE